MVQLDKVIEAEKLVKALLGRLKKEPAREAELRRLLARIYATSGRLDDAVKEAQLSAKAYEAAGDLYRAAASNGYIGDLYREVGEAHVLLKPGHAATAEEIIAFCRARLANYKVPKRAFVRDDLPMLPVGKIDKALLRRQAADG